MPEAGTPKTGPTGRFAAWTNITFQVWGNRRKKAWECCRECSGARRGNEEEGWRVTLTKKQGLKRGIGGVLRVSSCWGLKMGVC